MNNTPHDRRPTRLSREGTLLRALGRTGLAAALAGPGAALVGYALPHTVHTPRWQDALQPALLALIGAACVLFAVALSIPAAGPGVGRISGWFWGVSLVASVLVALRTIGPATTSAMTLLGGLGLAGAARWLSDELTDV